MSSAAEASLIEEVNTLLKRVDDEIAAEVWSLTSHTLKRNEHQLMQQTPCSSADV